jgi:predicted transcriptional regulator
MEDNSIMEIKLSSPERLYAKCYHDFMDCKLLNGTEKIVFLALKRFLDVKSDNGKVFPTVERISEMLEYTRPTVTKAIKSLVKKGVVKKIRQGLSKPNTYILADYPTMWECETVDELQEVVENQGVRPLTAAEHIAELEKMGYKVEIKEKGLVSTAPTKVTAETSPKSNYLCNDNFNAENRNRQVEYEKYTLEDVKIFFDYDILMLDYARYKDDIESVFNILHDALNSTKATIRVQSENKPRAVVIAKLMKLNYNDIIYAIHKYNEQTERISNPTSYILSLLYVAHEQNNFDLTNQVQYNMANWNVRE